MKDLEQELEIEFKNMLTLEEYQELLQSEFLNQEDPDKITQTNYYFDTEYSDLKKQGAALRMRTSSSFREITLKSPSDGYLMETNLSLDKETASSILQNKKISLSADIFSNEKVDLKDIPKNASFHLFNSMSTERFEKGEDIHLLVLDKTTYPNGKVDYELEVESKDEKKGKEFFQSFLEKHSIPHRSAQPKIARAEHYRKLNR